MPKPPAHPRDQADDFPLGGIEIEQEINAIRYELVVKAKGQKVWLIIRAYSDGTVGISVRYTAL